MTLGANRYDLSLRGAQGHPGGLGLREVAILCDLDHFYVSRTLKGERVPHRDVLISLCALGYRQTRLETDEVLLLARASATGPVTAS